MPPPPHMFSFISIQHNFCRLFAISIILVYPGTTSTALHRLTPRCPNYYQHYTGGNKYPATSLHLQSRIVFCTWHLQYSVCMVLLVHHRSLKVKVYSLLPMCCWCGQIALLGPGTDTKIREHTRMKRSVRQLFIVKMLLKRLKILYTSHTATYKL